MTPAAAVFGAGDTRQDAQRRLRSALAAAGLEEAALDARVLLGAALRLDGAALLMGGAEPLGEVGAARLAGLAARRLAREPVARILGSREFWGLPFRLSPATLVPRPETETVVEEALACLADRTAGRAILDLGTGSGAILVALLHELPAAWGVGLDRSPDALACAAGNAAANGVADRAAYCCSDWATAVDGRFDLVVSNPPYIRAGLVAGLAPEVRSHDPVRALDGGPDGLAAYRAILADLPRLLVAGGAAVLEIGFDQAEAVSRLAEGAGLTVERLATDLAGRPRAVVLRVSPADGAGENRAIWREG